MKLQEIFESLDSKINYEVTKETNKWFVTRAKINNRYIEVDFVLDRPEDSAWYIEFLEYKIEDGDGSGTVSGNGTSKLTNSGSELKVFSLVLQSFTEFIQRYHPLEISFTSEKENSSRTKLYKRFIDRYAKKLGYKLESIKAMGTHSDDIILVKI